MGREDPQLKLRISQELKDKLLASARARGRTMNAEIAFRLDRTFAMDATNEEIYERLARSKPPENIPFPESEDDYGVEIPVATDPSVGAVEAEFHHEMFQLTRRMARKLSDLRDGNHGVLQTGSGDASKPKSPSPKPRSTK